MVATCLITLELPGVASLKEKRRILKSILARMRREFNIAAAEVDYQDVWQSAAIGLAAVGNDGRYLHSVLEKSVGWLETNRPDVPIVDYRIEFR